MERKGKWYNTVKNFFSSESKEKKDQKSKQKSIWRCGKFEDSSRFDSEPFDSSAREGLPPPPPRPVAVEVNRPDVENEQRNHAYSVALASAVAAEAAAVAAQAAAQVARLTASSRFAARSREEIAAIKIQTAFRGHMARRRLRALRGLVRLKTLVEGKAVRRQATNTLRCMQTLARVQSQIHSRRIRMLENNHALQRQLQLKCEGELERSKLGEEWNDSLHSKEQIETNLLNKQEAAIRRERALAYAYSYQWKNSSRSVTPTFTDPNNPHWGWSWLERWMVARPWESLSTTDRELNSDHASVKSTSQSVGGGEIIKAYARRDSNLDRPSPTTQKLNRPASGQSSSTPISKTSLLVGKIKSASPKTGWGLSDDDSRSVISIQSERPRRHSLAESSIRDDESLASSPAVPSYMAPTESARAKTRLQSLLNDKIEGSDTGSVGSVKKRLSFQAGDKSSVTSPAGARRHSGPPKVDIASIKDVEVHTDHKLSNGVSR